MSKVGSLTQEVQEIVEENPFRLSTEILEEVALHFSNRPEMKNFAVEIAKFEIRQIQEDLMTFRI
jgi:dihydroneopterin aldolase